MTAISSPLASSSGKLRPFDVRRDLDAVANLVELCFSDTLDASGRRYIRQMRLAAKNPRYLRWAKKFTGGVSTPLGGYIWEEEGYVAGNLSIIPVSKQGRRYYLIANVAVDAKYRRQGIARALTTAALGYIQRSGAQNAWLQVREESNHALDLYKSFGFKERVRRTTWESVEGSFGSLLSDPSAPPSEVTVTSRSANIWPQQRAWLERIYSPEVTWQLPFYLNTLRPGLSGLLYRLVMGTYRRQWAALRGGQPLGVLSWQPGTIHVDHLWLATSPEHEDVAIRALLPHARKHFSNRRHLDLNYPAGRGFKAFHDVGFQVNQTLIWMEFKFKNKG